MSLDHSPDPFAAALAAMTEAALPGAEAVLPHGPRAHDAASAPICQSASFLFDDYSQIAEVFAGRSDRYVYSRGNNPTVREFESLIARMEGAEAARGFASGMAAIAASTIPFLKAGDRVVAPRNLYSDAFRLFETLLSRYGVTTTYVDGTDAAAMEAAIPGAALVYLESPTSWAFELQDIPRIAAAAKAAGALSVMDNSWATPLFCNPLALGVDIVVHAASKYLSGHSDVIGGVAAGRKDLIAAIDHLGMHLLGGRMSPLDAWLTLRGLQTLPLRMRAHMEGGLRVAEALSRDARIARVMHPARDPAHAAKGLRGHGGLFAFELAPGLPPQVFCDALRQVRLGVSWGGSESLIIPAKAALDLAGANNVFRRFGTSAQCMRLAVGLESPDLLIADLLAALSTAEAAA